MESNITANDSVEELTNNGDDRTENSTASNHITTTNASLSAVTHHNSHTTDEVILIKIAEIKSDITFLWKIHAMVTYEYPKRTFLNTHGTGEVSNWDLTDESGSITLVAFNLHSYMMADKIKKNIIYEFTNMSIRPASDAYKTLPHPFQLICTNATRVQEINVTFNHQHISFNFTHLREVDSLPLNSIIDVQGRVSRDFGICNGIKNDTVWARRQIHITEDEIHISTTLWNDQARLIERNMAGLKIKMKNIKISWFDGLYDINKST